MILDGAHFVGYKGVFRTQLNIKGGVLCEIANSWKRVTIFGKNSISAA